MKKSLAIIALVAVSLASLESCCDKIPEMTGYEVWTITGVAFGCSDFSAITKSFDESCFIGAFNSGGLYYIEFPSEGDTTVNTSPLWSYGVQFSDGARDMEGIALDHASGDLYFSQERATRKDGEIIYAGNSIYRLRYPDYAEVETVHSFGEEYFAANNATIEGFTWVGDGKYMLGREGIPGKAEYPAAIMAYSPEDGITSVDDISALTKQIAGMEYDAKNDWVWILDGDHDKLLHILEASGDHAKVADYDISFIANAEGICLDRSSNCLWIASDETPSKLYKLSFKGL